jgi:hypothetical protein
VSAELRLIERQFQNIKKRKNIKTKWMNWKISQIPWLGFFIKKNQKNQKKNQKRKSLFYKEEHFCNCFIIYLKKKIEINIFIFFKMDFLLYERKFKFVDDVLYSFYKHGRSKTEKWHVVKLKIDNGYKRFSFRIKGKSKYFYYHRVVYYANNPEWDFYDNSLNNFIDHIDQTKTNNHISNLRVVTQQENTFNTSCKGYTFIKSCNKYKAKIQLNRKNIYLGHYDTPEEAHEAYLNKKAEVHIIQVR